MFVFFVMMSVHWDFFFQAEDGIRDTSVTGVQTCALPIWTPAGPGPAPAAGRAAIGIASVNSPVGGEGRGRVVRHAAPVGGPPARPRIPSTPRPAPGAGKIGRASCRERVENAGSDVALKEK